ncbi:MAG: hypothetical protein AAF810_17735 [Cyanobacteria bacterium P01_D01_bin.36]
MSTPIPRPGEIWQHQKHDEEAGHFHQYEIICITEPGECPFDDAPSMFTCVHVETGRWHDVLFNADPRCWMHPALDVAHVVYQNIVPEMDGEKVWGRALNDFMGDREGKPRLTKSNRQENSMLKKQLPAFIDCNYFVLRFEYSSNTQKAIKFLRSKDNALEKFSAKDFNAFETDYRLTEGDYKIDGRVTECNDREPIAMTFTVQRL